MITNDDLYNLQALAQKRDNTPWLPLGAYGARAGVVCHLKEVIMIALTPDELDLLVSELLDARARIARIEKGGGGNNG